MMFLFFFINFNLLIAAVLRLMHNMHKFNFNIAAIIINPAAEEKKTLITCSTTVFFFCCCAMFMFKGGFFLLLLFVEDTARIKSYQQLSWVIIKSMKPFFRLINHQNAEMTNGIHTPHNWRQRISSYRTRQIFLSTTNTNNTFHSQVGLGNYQYI